MSSSLDTNVLLRLILNDVPEQTVIVEKLLASAAIFEIADAAIFEMVFVLEKLYKLPREHVAENVLTVVRNKKFNCNRRLLEAILTLYIAQSKLSIIDCALTFYANLNTATPLYTFYQALAKASPDNVTLLMSHGT